jgi:hypothetical protein
MIVLFCLPGMCPDGPVPGSFYEIVDLIFISEVLLAAVIVMDHFLGSLMNFSLG